MKIKNIIFKQITLFLVAIFLVQTSAYPSKVENKKVTATLATRPFSERGPKKAVNYLYVLAAIGTHFLTRGLSAAELNDSLIELWKENTESFKDVTIKKVKGGAESVVVEFEEDNDLWEAEITKKQKGLDFVYKKLGDGDLAAQESEEFIDGILNMEKYYTEYLMHNITKKALEGKTDAALKQFFSSGKLQYLRDQMDLPETILNNLLEGYIKNPEKKDNVLKFLKELIKKTVELTENEKTKKEDSYAFQLQLMAGQIATIMYWVESGSVDQADKIRITSVKGHMVSSGKGYSVIDKHTLPEGLGIAQLEGAPGFFWRGTEGIEKLDEGIIEGLKYDSELFDEASKKMIMYLMDHGFIKVNDSMIEETSSDPEQAKTTTIHETYFINDFLPGSFQTTSTGPGHAQGMDLDIKYVTEGEGVQYNVLFDEKGKIKKIKETPLTPGTVFFALPGYVDYVVNFGGLRFTDCARKNIDIDQAKIFAGKQDLTNEEYLAWMKKSAENRKNYKKAPYIAARVGEEQFLVETIDPEKEGISIETLSFSEEIKERLGIKGTLIQTYNYATPEIMSNIVKQLVKIFYKEQEKIINVEQRKYSIVKENNIDLKRIKREAAKTEKTSFKTEEGVNAFIDENEIFLQNMIKDKTMSKKVIRISEQTIDAVGAENIKGFLQNLEKTNKVSIEIFSLDEPIAGKSYYEKVGLKKPELPETFEMSRRNTITLLPVMKKENLPSSEVNREWIEIAKVSPKESIISPIGFNYDKAGVIRSILLGLRLSEMARKKNRQSDAEEEKSFAEETLRMYRKLCFSQGIEDKEFTVTAEDLIAIAYGESFSRIIEALNRVIDSLPIIPFNIEEVRNIHKRMERVRLSA